MKMFCIALDLNRLPFWHGRRLVGSSRGRTKEFPLHVRPQLFARHAGFFFNRRTAQRWHRSSAGHPLAYRWRLDTQQARQATNPTHRGARFLDRFLFHGRESKALPNASQEALPNPPPDGSN